MEAIEGQAAKVPTWSDELYLEGHRGTLTSQGWIKRANRKAEIALHDAEFLAAATGTAIDLREAWERLCLNQFHDILPGTSVPSVFADSRKDYAFIAEETDAALAACILPGEGRSVASTIPFANTRVVALARGRRGAPRHTKDGAIALMTLTPYSVTPLAPEPPKTPVTVRDDGTGVVMQKRASAPRIRRPGPG